MFATLTLPAPCDLSSMPRAETVAVRSADELRQAMRQSRTRPMTLDASGLDRILRLETSRGLVEVQAATSWAALAAYSALSGSGLEAFAAAPGMPRTVGEAVGSNPPGPDGAPFASHVAAVVLVTPEGELRRADESNPELLRLIIGGQGVFGVLYSVTLRLDSLRQSAANALEPAELILADASEAQGPACEIELLLPPESLERFLGEIRALSEERRLALQSITVRRSFADARSRLNWASREWAAVRVRFGIRASLGATVYAAETRRELLARALACGGSFPIADLRDATRAQLERCYPGLSAFLAEKRRCDPAERLQNAWFRKACAILRGEQCESRWSQQG
jgi:FAD/FMN-containing dehydrogenase